ncbi:MAG: UDP-glucose/GDP-mannose dehydrogenase family protein [Caulobacteraceae bacterium]
MADVTPPMKLVIVGSGYVGLVTGVCFAALGHQVICVDRDGEKIAKLRAGITPIYEPGLEPMIARNLAGKRLRFDTDLPDLMAIDAVFIAVGTPPKATDQGADLSSVFAVAGEVARRLDGRVGGRCVVVTKSTVPVGTGDAIERLIRAAAPRLAVSVVSNPEFLREGEAIGDFLRPDRVVIGAEDAWGRRIVERIYAPLAADGVELLLISRRAAELVKYAANAFLATKISFINEMADLCEAVDADIDEVATGIGLDKRIGAAFLKAGPGYGGSCFPKDCAALLTTAQDNAVDLRVVESALTANQLRKRLMARRVVTALGGVAEGKTVAILGLTFKAETDDMRDAPSITIVDVLRQAGARLRVYDPQGMPQARAVLGEVAYAASALECCAGADVIVVTTEWREFAELDLEAVAAVAPGRLILDMRNILDPARVAAAGFDLHGIGRRAEPSPTRRRPAAVARVVAG